MAKKSKPLLIDAQLREAIRNSGLTLIQISEQAGIAGGALSRFMTDDPAAFRDLRMATAARVADALGLELVPKRKPKT